jgi:hypothetical protein
VAGEHHFAAFFDVLRRRQTAFPRQGGVKMKEDSAVD